ncbi:hypothetical protein D3C73_608690 [compost metagenome]
MMYLQHGFIILRAVTEFGAYPELTIPVGIVDQANTAQPARRLLCMIGQAVFVMDVTHLKVRQSVKISFMRNLGNRSQTVDWMPHQVHSMRNAVLAGCTSFALQHFSQEYGGSQRLTRR